MPTLLFEDDPAHRRQRGLVQGPLGAEGVRRLEPEIAAIAGRLSAALPERGELELVADFATPLPIAVLAHVLGIADGDAERFRRWSQSVVDLGAPLGEDRGVAVAEDYVALQRHLAGRIREGGAGEGLLASLGAAACDRTATLPELLGVATQVIAAGNDPTTAALASLVHRIAIEPGLQPALRSDRSLIDAALDETLRLDSPVAMFRRRATRDVELRGGASRRARRSRSSTPPRTAIPPSGTGPTSSG